MHAVLLTLVPLMVAAAGQGFSFRLDKSSLAMSGNTAVRAFPQLFLTQLEEKNVFNPNGAPPEGPWQLDMNEFGTRDFRAAKYNIYDTSIRAKDGRGVRVDSDGSADVRACLTERGVALHLLQSEPRGENTLPWPLGSAPRQLTPGARITGTFSVRLEM